MLRKVRMNGQTVTVYFDNGRVLGALWVWE
jgi:sRNA-binding regulator protein Hfq